MPDNKRPNTVPPGAWIRLFASTLLRLYPKTGNALAADIAHRQYATNGATDPVEAAELYALEEGQPRTVAPHGAKPSPGG